MPKRTANSDRTQAATIAADLRVLVGKLRRRLREEVRSGGLSMSQLSVLSHLDREGPATISTLARKEGVKPQSMGATVSSLIAEGLVCGEPHPTDGRQTLLSTTPKCRELITSIRAAREDWLSNAILTSLSADEQSDLARVTEFLKRIADS